MNGDKQRRSVDAARARMGRNGEEVTKVRAEDVEAVRQRNRMLNAVIGRYREVIATMRQKQSRLVAERGSGDGASSRFCKDKESTSLRNLLSPSVSPDAGPHKKQEFVRWYTLQKTIEGLARATTYKKFIQFLVMYHFARPYRAGRQLPDLIECSRWSVVVVDDSLIDITNKYPAWDVTVQKSFQCGRSFNLFSRSVDTCSSPQFLSLPELSSGRKMYLFLSLRSLSPRVMFKGTVDPITKALLMGIQLERSMSGSMYSGEYMGFTAQDDAMLAVLSTAMGTQLAALGDRRMLKSLEKSGGMVPNLAVKLLEPRSVPRLLAVISNLMPEALEYEYVSATYYDAHCTVPLRKQI